MIQLVVETGTLTGQDAAGRRLLDYLLTTDHRSGMRRHYACFSEGSSGICRVRLHKLHAQHPLFQTKNTLLYEAL